MFISVNLTSELIIRDSFAHSNALRNETDRDETLTKVLPNWIHI